MTIDADTLVKVAQFALTVAGIIYAWVVSQGKTHEPKFKELSERLEKDTKALNDGLSAATGRIAKIEGEMVHLPDKDMVHRIELGMKDMQSRIEAQAEVVKAVERTMQRVETFLLDAQSSKPSAARRK